MKANSKETDNQIIQLVEAECPTGEFQLDRLISDQNIRQLHYHLSSLRRALLSWYPFSEGCRVLELGSGFGALTGLLSEKAGFVDAVEADIDRLKASQKRYAGCSNIRWINKDPDSFPAEALSEGAVYDLIIVIDPAGYYDEDQCGLVERFLELIAPGGALILGWRNRFGSRYACGGLDDLVTEPFSNISAKGLMTAADAAAAAEKCGLYSRNYYVYPDQIFPQVILTDEGLPKESFKDRIVTYDLFGSPAAADETEYLDAAVKAGRAADAANFVLTEYRKEPFEERRITKVILSPDRGAQHSFQTAFFSDGTVEKSAVFEEGIPVARMLCKNLSKLSAKGLDTVPCELKNGRIIMPLIKEESLMSVIKRSSPEEIIKILDEISADCIKASDIVSEDEKYGPVLAEGYPDMIPYNIFASNGRMVYYDQEFCVPACPLSYIMYRAVKYTYIHLPELEEKLPQDQLKERFGLSAIWEDLEKKERDFAFSNRCFDVYGYFWKHPQNRDVPENRRLLMQKNSWEKLHTEELDAVHAVQLEMIKAFDKVCKDNGLKYIAVHGTLLGAARHRGFIPWDDDVDLAMPRADYDRFMKVASQMGSCYFVQNLKTESCVFFGGYSKIRDSRTSAIEKYELDRNCNQGIWIDLMPLDNVPDDKTECKKLESRIRRLQKLIFSKVYPDHSFSAISGRRKKQLVFAGKFLNLHVLSSRLEKLFRSAPKGLCTKILACYYPWGKNDNLFSSDMETVMLPFEDMMLPVPSNYEEILIRRYGPDYMSAKTAKRKHTNVVFDAKTPYTEKKRWITEGSFN